MLLFYLPKPSEICPSLLLSLPLSPGGWVKL